MLILLMYFEKLEPGQLSRHSDGLRAGLPGFASWQGQNYSLFHGVQTNSGAHQASYPMGTRVSFPGGEAYHSPPSSAEVKIGGVVPPLPRMCSSA
jgi:hypothetical protein